MGESKWRPSQVSFAPARPELGCIAMWGWAVSGAGPTARAPRSLHQRLPV
jgi:hypothetical protein